MFQSATPCLPAARPLRGNPAAKAAGSVLVAASPCGAFPAFARSRVIFFSGRDLHERRGAGQYLFPLAAGNRTGRRGGVGPPTDRASFRGSRATVDPSRCCRLARLSLGRRR